MDIENFIKQFEDCYFLAYGEKLDAIKKPYTIKNEDGSTLVEWPFVKFRIGFSFENPTTASFFYIVSTKDELRNLMHSESIKNQSELDAAIRMAVNYIIENKDK